MLLFAKTFSGKKYAMEIDSLEDTVGSVKAKLEVIEGIPVDQQSLVFNHIRLEEDDNTLAHYGIQNYSTINFNLKVQNNHRLTVETITGKPSVTLELDSLQTINDIKYMIEKKIAIPVARQSLWKGERRLDNFGEAFLTACNIHSGATLKVYPIPKFPLMS